MFGLSKKRSGARPQPHPVQLRLEELEDRRLLSNFLVLDFTPDAIQGESYYQRPFADAFNMRYTNGTRPGFLDMNGDRAIDNRDVDVAANAIAARVQQHLQGYNINVIYGDVWRNTGWGVQWVNYGRAYASEQAYVMYVGGYKSDGILGEAYQAPVGYNNEYYAHTYFSAVVNWFMRNQQGASARNVVDLTAKAIVHEFGHLAGLGHVYGNPQGDPSIMNYSSNAATAYIPNAWYRYVQQHDIYGRSAWTWQNPAQELANSLAGQPTAPVNGMFYTRAFGVPGLHALTADELGETFADHGNHPHDADTHHDHEHQQRAGRGPSVHGVVETSAPAAKKERLEFWVTSTLAAGPAGSHAARDVSALHTKQETASRRADLPRSQKPANTLFFERLGQGLERLGGIG